VHRFRRSMVAVAAVATEVKQWRSKLLLVL